MIDIPGLKIIPKKKDVYFDRFSKLNSKGTQKGKYKLCLHKVEKITGQKFGFICRVVLNGRIENPPKYPGCFYFHITDLENIYSSPIKERTFINFQYDETIEGCTIDNFHYHQKDNFFVFNIKNEKFLELEKFIDSDYEYAQECMRKFSNNFLKKYSK